MQHEHGEDGVQHRAEITLVDRERDIGSDPGQQHLVVGDADGLAGDDEEPAARHRHHHVPNQLRQREGHFELPEALPGREVIHPRGFAQIVRHRDERLVQAERHVPGLRGEDRENGGAFVAEEAAGKEPDEAGDGDGQEAENRHRLQDVEDRDQNLLGPLVLGGNRGIAEAEHQRRSECRDHAQHGSEAIFGQIARIERDRELLARNERHAHLLARPGDQRDSADDERQRYPVPEAGHETRRPRDDGQAPALLHRPVPFPEVRSRERV